MSTSDRDRAEPGSGTDEGSTEMERSEDDRCLDLKTSQKEDMVHCLSGYRPRVTLTLSMSDVSTRHLVDMLNGVHLRLRRVLLYEQVQEFTYSVIRGKGGNLGVHIDGGGDEFRNLFRSGVEKKNKREERVRKVKDGK